MTEDQIISAVSRQVARSLKEISKLTGAMRNEHCEVNHPIGKEENEAAEKQTL